MEGVESFFFVITPLCKRIYSNNMEFLLSSQSNSLPVSKIVFYGWMSIAVYICLPLAGQNDGMDMESRGIRNFCLRRSLFQFDKR